MRIKDTYLDQSVPGQGLNYGSAPILRVGDGGGFECRVLVSFEVTSKKPANRQIAHAALILTCVNTPIGAPQPVCVYTEVDSWIEGVDIGAFTQPGASWMSPGGPIWTNPFNPAYVPPLVVGGGSFQYAPPSPPNPPPVPVTFSMVSGPAVYYFGDVNPALSLGNGMILAYSPAVWGVPPVGDFKDFASRENGVAGQIPKLKLYLVK